MKRLLSAIMLYSLALIVYLNEPIPGCQFMRVPIINSISNDIVPYVVLVRGNYNIYGVLGYDANGHEYVIPWTNTRGFKNETNSN